MAAESKGRHQETAEAGRMLISISEIFKKKLV